VRGDTLFQQISGYPLFRPIFFDPDFAVANGNVENHLINALFISPANFPQQILMAFIIKRQNNIVGISAA
jgi:hypothetical protein